MSRGKEGEDVAGLDKIIDEILAEAKNQAENRIEAANKEAEAILAEVKKECEAMAQEASDKEKAMKELQESRMQSSMEQQRKRAILRAKQEVIREVIDSVYQFLKHQETEDYFENIKKCIQTYALPEAGEIYFSKEDLERMPLGFERTIELAASEAGGSLRLMKETRPIEDGFILVYGGIEENCTFRAIIDAKKDELQDTVHQILFR